MNAILERFWNWIRTIEYGVLVRWGAAIFVIAVWVHPYAKAVAEETVLQILKEKGFTVEDFKDVQTSLKDLSATAGSMQQSIGNINNTLTINAGRAIDAEKDRDAIKLQVDRLVDYIINKKTDRENYPQ